LKVDLTWIDHSDSNIAVGGAETGARHQLLAARFSATPRSKDERRRREDSEQVKRGDRDQY